MRDLILKAAADLNADLVGFAPASRFDSDDVLFQIMPDVKTVIGLGFRVLRGTYRGIEEGSTYYQYTTMAVESLEEVIMPTAMMGVCAILTDRSLRRCLLLRLLPLRRLHRLSRPGGPHGAGERAQRGAAGRL